MALLNMRQGRDEEAEAGFKRAASNGILTFDLDSLRHVYPAEPARDGVADVAPGDVG